MDLSKKKKLAERTFGVGRERVVFIESRLGDIKDAITKQDIRDLHNDGAIIIRDIKGRRKVVRKTNKSKGNVRKKVKKGKREYLILTRKLRRYISDLSKQGKISKSDFNNIRKKIRNKSFKNKMQLKEQMEGGSR